MSSRVYIKSKKPTAFMRGVASRASAAAASSAARTARIAKARALQAAFRSRVSLPAGLRSSHPEIKSCDLVAAPVEKILSTTATFNLLNGVQEGSSFYNRIGRKIMMRSIYINGSIVPTTNGTGSAEYNRIMVVYDRQPNGATPAIADILLDYDNTGTTTTTSVSNINMNNAERFIILADDRYDVPNNGNAVATTNVASAVQDYEGRYNYSRFVKLKNLETHYKSTTNPAVIGDIASGALWLITYGNIGVANAGYTFNFSGRLRYHDI